LRLIVLNSCEGATSGGLDIFSSTASILLRAGLPAVLAMQYEITDSAAAELAHSFYEALADGLPVDAALAEARKAMDIAVPNSVEWGVPVLHMRAPDGVLFHLTPRSVQLLKEEQPKLAPSLAQKRISVFDQSCLIKEYWGHTYHVNAVAWSPDDSLLASCSGDKKAFVWDVKTGEVKNILQHDRWVGSIAFSPLEAYLATSDGNGNLRVWNLRRGDLVANRYAYDGPSRTICFSPDGMILFSGGKDGKIQLDFCSDTTRFCDTLTTRYSRQASCQHRQ